MDSSIRVSVLSVRIIAASASFVAAWFAAQAGAPVATLIALALAIVQIVLVVHREQRVDRSLARFIDAVRHDDLATRYQATNIPETLAKAMDAALERFRRQRAATEAEALALRAVVEHAPIAMVSVDPDGAAALLNAAARRMFDRSAVARLEEFRTFGSQLKDTLESIEPGERRLVIAKFGERERRLAVTATRVTQPGRQRTIAALENIEGELEAAEAQARDQLIRVLTHEIMNSLTPVASLSETARSLSAQMLDQASHDGSMSKWEGKARDVHEACDAVARRSIGLKRFVEAYRKIARLPPPERSDAALGDVFSELTKLFNMRAEQCGIRFEATVQPPDLRAMIDVDQLEQALVNLISNAFDAVEPAGCVRVSARRGKANELIIDVADNGSGVSDDALDQLFFPFFSTKPGGSGIGLSLVRQIVNNHRGSVFHIREGDWTIFRAIF